MLLCGSADPRFIEQCKALLPKVADLVQSLVCEEQPMDYTLRFRVYGIDGVRMVVPENEPPPGEVFIMGECIAPTRERASEVVRTCKQFLLHFGYPGRLSTAGNIAFPFTPPEVSLGPPTGSTSTTCCMWTTRRAVSRWRSKLFNPATIPPGNMLLHLE